MWSNALKFFDFQVSRWSFSSLVHSLWVAIVCLSAFKNLFFWDFGRLSDPEFFTFPVFSALRSVPASSVDLVLWLSFASLFLFGLSSGRAHGLVFIINGFANLFFMSLDYLSLHHDMLLSAVLFVVYGFFCCFKQERFKDILLSWLLAVVASTYFLSGLVKVDSNFLSGEMAVSIIKRASFTFYWPVFQYTMHLAPFLAWFAMFVELVEPLILLFFVGRFKLYTMLFAFPFHFGILLTGTGTVYNLIYPAAFLLFLSRGELSVINRSFISRLYSFIVLLFLSFSVMYLVLICFKFLKEI